MKTTCRAPTPMLTELKAKEMWAAIACGLPMVYRTDEVLALSNDRGYKRDAKPKHIR